MAAYSSALREALDDESLNFTKVVTGGIVNKAALFISELNGNKYFVKYNTKPEAQALFETERASLNILRSTGIVRVPHSLKVCRVSDELGSVHILEYLENLQPLSDHWSAFGQQIARLHSLNGKLLAARHQGASRVGQGDTPDEGVGVPGEGVRVPGEGVGLPGEGVGVLGERVGVFSEEVRVPGGGMGVPSEGTRVPGEGVGGPSEGVRVPGEGVGVPGEGMGIPGGGVRLPSEGLGVPGEGMGVLGEGVGMPGKGVGVLGEGVGLLSEGMETSAALQPSERFGSDMQHFIGTFSVGPVWRETWEEYFIGDILNPLVEGLETKYQDQEVRESWSWLKQRLHRVFDGMSIQPAINHGDLCPANFGQTPEGPVLFDPAVNFAHSEFDLILAFTEGGFSPEFFSAYFELLPQRQGFEHRLEVYRLFYNIVMWYHVEEEAFREGTHRAMANVTKLLQTKFGS